MIFKHTKKVSKRIMDLHGGGLEVSSEGEGKGCLFTIYIPACDALSLSVSSANDGRHAPSVVSNNDSLRGSRRNSLAKLMERSAALLMGRSYALLDSHSMNKKWSINSNRSSKICPGSVTRDEVVDKLTITSQEPHCRHVSSLYYCDHEEKENKDRYINNYTINNNDNNNNANNNYYNSDMKVSDSVCQLLSSESTHNDNRTHSNEEPIRVYHDPQKTTVCSDFSKKSSNMNSVKGKGSFSSIPRSDSFVSEFGTLSTLSIIDDRLSGDSRKPRVLIVDDASSNRKMLTRLLRSRCTYTEEVDDGLKAIQRIKKSLSNLAMAKAASSNQSPMNYYSGNNNNNDPLMNVASSSSTVELDYFDIIVMDFVMPNMDGPTATKEIRKLGYSGLVFGLTGNALKSDVDSFIACGANMVLTKPLDIKHFDDAVKAYFLNS